VTDAATLAQRMLGATPAGVWAAPGRVNLIGEHTDYNGGLVLPFALAERTQAAIRPRDDGRLRICSDQVAGIVELTVAELGPGVPQGWGAYVAGVLWALGVDSGFDIAISSDVPVGSGLSSSAALTCSVALGVNELASTGRDRRRLAQLTRRAENDYVGAPTGGMDQMAALLCTAGHALLYDTAEERTEQIPFDPAGAGLTVLVVDTRVRHAHAGGEYAARRRDCESAARRLGVSLLGEIVFEDLDAALARLDGEQIRKRARHVITENHRVAETTEALAAGDWARVGALLTAAHASIRDDFEASCPELDLAVAALLEAGAIGARMTGGGFGGSALALVPTTRLAPVRAGVEAAFARAAFSTPHSFTVAPSDGAGRVA
jgi:galactokinase